jgi:hypothetical protein
MTGMGNKGTKNIAEGNSVKNKGIEDVVRVFMYLIIILGI